ncbi:MAG: DUF1836 domain-containing protein [Eubacteriales bacterium]|nr:DUF1836 domain-containing protein [Eubacteriales bacterium]
MTINTEDMLQSILASLSRIDYIKPDDIPNIDLYMDQVTTFMDSQLKSSKRYQEDKVLTKTMINNYAKNHLLPTPDKKKYSKEHVLLLIFIYYFKGFLSIGDIQSLLDPLTKKYFKNAESINVESIYREVFSMEKVQIESMQADLSSKYAIAQDTFKDASEEDAAFLRLFSFISLLSFDVYVKKQIIEKIIDSFQDD